MDGVLVVDKPAGPTSHDVVDRARRALGTRRVGHTGTLDPFATGVLVLCVGRATRLAVVSVNTDHGHLESTLSAVAGEAATARDVLLVDQQLEIL